MIETLQMACRLGSVSPDTKLYAPCKETEGNALHDIITKGQCIPANVGDGSIEFNTNYAVRIKNNTDLESTPWNYNLVLNTRKAILLAAVLIPRDGANTRVNLGVNDGITPDRNVFSLSLAGGMHISFFIDGQVMDYTSLGAGTTLAPDTPFVIYLLWNGIGTSASIAGTITAKVLNMDGSIYTPIATPYSLSDTPTVIEDTFRPDPISRLTDADYFSIMLKELNYIPAHLDYKLAQWGVEAMKNNKGAPFL